MVLLDYYLATSTATATATASTSTATLINQTQSSAHDYIEHHGRVSDPFLPHS